MDPRRVASAAAVLGGLGWMLKVALIWANGGSNTDSGLVLVMQVAGLVGLFVALAAAGYTLVERAPVWLRAVVAVATPLLVLMVWALMDQAIKAVYTKDTWLRDELSVVVAAVVAVVLGLWETRRRQALLQATEATHAAAPRPVRGRRAAR